MAVAAVLSLGLCSRPRLADMAPTTTLRPQHMYYRDATLSTDMWKTASTDFDLI